MLKWSAIALSAAVAVSINGLVQAADEPAETGSKPADEEVIIESRKTTPQSVNPKATHTQDVITSKQLSEIPVTTDFIQALQYLPNVDVYEAGGNGLNGSNITINGFDQTRLNFTIDGIPINDNDSYSFYSNEFAQNPDIAQISVSPSAGTATTIGLSAFGGSIDILTKDPSAEHAAYLMGGAGSFGTFSQYAKLETGEFLKSIAPTSAFISFTHASSEGYFDNSNTDYKDDILFKSATAIGPGTLTLYFAQNDQQYHYYNGCQASSTSTNYSSSTTATGATPVPYPTQATAGNECNTYNSTPTSEYWTGWEINRYKDSLSYAGYSVDIGRAKIENKVYLYYGSGFGGGAEKGEAPYDPAQYVGDILPERSWNNTNRIGDVLTATVPIVDELTLKAGWLYQHSNERHNETVNDPVAVAPIPGDEIYDESVLTKTYEPYVNLTLQPVSPLIIDVGTRYLIMDRDFLNNESLSTAYPGTHVHIFLPSLGANYEFTPGYHVYANYTENARPPGYSNYYATAGYNQDLSLEQAKTFEGGFIVRSGNLEGRLSAFHTKYSNYILSVEAPLPNSTSAGNAIFNVGDATYYGTSLALTYQFTEWFSGFLNAGWLHTSLGPVTEPYLTLPETSVNNAPKSTAALGFEVHQGGFSGSLAGHYRGTRLDWGLDSYTSGSAKAGTLAYHNIFSTYQLPNLFTLDASAAYKWDRPFGPGTFKSIEARLTFTNITNQQKPLAANSSSLTGYELSNPLLVLSEPFSVFATVMLSF